MRLLQHIASVLLLIGLLCPATQAAGQPDPLADESARRAAANWRDVLARIDSEEETLAACRATPDACSPAARQLLRIVELGRQRAGRARLGEINRAVNLSIKATSDWSQYGVDDFWSTPLATLEKGAGDGLRHIEIPGASRSRCQPRRPAPPDRKLPATQDLSRRPRRPFRRRMAAARQPDDGDGEQPRSNTISASDCIG